MTSIVGAHNAMTFLPARRWWWNILSCFWRCQSSTPMQMFSRGVRCFDIRVCWDMNRGWVFAHGMVVLDSRWGIEPWISDIVSLGSENDPVMIRLILEKVDNSRYDVECDMFKMLCERLEYDYPTVRFIGGFLKPGWKRLHVFGPEPKTVQPVSSMAKDAHWWERVLPKVYWKRRGRYAEPQGEVCLMDFIQT